MKNKIMKSNIVMKYKITESSYPSLGSLSLGSRGFATYEESNTELFTEIDNELEVDKNYIVNDVEFTVKEQYYDLTNNCMVYYTDIETIDENLEEKYKVELELQKNKFDKLQKEHKDTCNELSKLKYQNRNQVVAVPDCNRKKKRFSFFNK